MACADTGASRAGLLAGWYESQPYMEELGAKSAHLPSKLRQAEGGRYNGETKDQS
jgi:hypothetical protein